MGYPYDGPTDLSGLRVLWHLPKIRRAILDTPPAIQLTLDYLLKRPDVDPARVELVGVSFGAFFTPVAAALDPRVTRLWLIHGAADPRRVLEQGLRTTVPYALPRALVAIAGNVVFAGPALAPERWVPRVAPRPVIMINASDDERLPPDAVETLYASARAPKERIWVAGQHLHPTRDDLIREIMDIVLSRAAEDTR
jgi:dienelactone hydrolase